MAPTKFLINNLAANHLCILLALFFSSPIFSHSALVEFLPGFVGPLPFHLETGYVGVGDREEVQLFYYFTKSESNPQEDPLIIFLSGGPGCSSLSALLFEIGPLMYEQQELNGSVPSLILNPNSWTKMASIIFLDSPVGAGFSYAETENASKSTQLHSSGQAYEFMRKWLINHPQFLGNPFYVAGDSYSGVIVPIITHLILDGNEAGIEPFINLKGYVLGNPLTFPEEDNYRIKFAHGMGLIPDELYLNLKRDCKGEYRVEYTNPDNWMCRQHIKAYNESLTGINLHSILDIDCPVPTTLGLSDGRRALDDTWRELHYPNHLLTLSPCHADGYKLMIYWANVIDVQEALHIRKGTVKKWIRCNYRMPYTTITWDVRPYHLNLSKKGYRSLIYSGDHDAVIVHQSTQSWIKALNYSIVDNWRSWKIYGQIAGYTRTYSNNMTFATVKGAGHIAPAHKPEECYAMFKRWISYEPL